MRFGGVLSHARTLKNELQRNNWDITLITLDNLPLWCRYIPHLVEKIFNFLNRPLGYYYKDRTTRILYKFLFNNNTDIRIFEDIYISWNSTTPSITILHAVWSDNLQSNPVKEHSREKLLSREINIINKINHSVVTVSEPYLNYLLNDHFCRRLKTHIGVIELGVDQSKFNANRMRDYKSIVFVGSLEARKNILFLLKIYKLINVISKKYKLTIIGDGPQAKILKQYSIDNDLNVKFLGALSHDAVIIELHSHGIYMHTSVKESFSYSLLEAKLAGLKTIASNNLQVPREFIDNPVDSFNVADWGNKILEIDFKPITFDADKYTIEKMTSRTLDLAK